MEKFFIASATANQRADYICDGVNDDIQINAAITALPAEGGVIVLSEGVFNIGDEISITNSNITLEGQGQATTIMVQNGANLQGAITLIGTGVIDCKVKSLTIDGDKANQTNGDGIYISTPWSSPTHDTQHLFEDLRIENIKNNGIEVAASSDTRVLIFNRIHIRECDGNGFYLPAPSTTDNIFTNCIVETVGLNGFYVGCLNSHFTNCKTFYCGSAGGNNHGYYISGYNNYFTTCEAQDNYQSGFYSQNDGDATYGARNCTFVNCIADSNGQTGGTVYAVGLQAKNVLGWQIIGGQYITRPYPSFTQRIGISLEGTTTSSVISGALTSGNSASQYSDTSNGLNYPLNLNGFVNSQLPGKLTVRGQIISSGGLIIATPVTLTDAGTVNTDASKSNTFYLALGGNRFIANPTGMADGQAVTWRIKPGGFTPTFGTAFNFGTSSYTPSAGTVKYDYIKGIFNNTHSQWDVSQITTGF